MTNDDFLTQMKCFAISCAAYPVALFFMVRPVAALDKVFFFLSGCVFNPSPLPEVVESVV